MNPTQVIEHMPYAGFLGIRVLEGEADLSLEIGPSDRFIGNPVLGAYHGGVIAGFMECAMSTAAALQLRQERPIQLVNLTTSYLGSADASVALRAETEVTKGRGRILSAHCRTYQNGDRLVAKASALYRVAND